MDEEADLSVPARTRFGVFVAVALLHVLVILALVRAFAPDFTQKAVNAVVSTFAVTVTAPPPSPEPAKSIQAAGAAAEAGKKAVAREVKAEKPRVSIAPTFAPLASNTGSADASGARESGAGTGAGGQGSGTGSGTGGGMGGGMVQKAVKIAGEINSARDYPIATRDLRIDDYVIIAITVGIDGRPSACRVHRPSKDAQANEITCRLAMQRFRFKPATDGSGNPVVSVYGWKQQWHY